MQMNTSTEIIRERRAGSAKCEQRGREKSGEGTSSPITQSVSEGEEKSGEDSGAPSAV